MPGVLRLPNGREIACLNRREALFIYKEIFEDGKYFARGIELSERALIVDAGANIGLFSIFVKERAPDASVFAFEPIPEIASVLQRNVAGLRACRVLPVGLSADDGQVDLTYFPDCPGMSGRYADTDEEANTMRTVITNIDATAAPYIARMLAHKLRGRPVRCTLRRLSSVMDEEGIDEIDLLKIDVEKSEHDVLAGIDARHWPSIRQLVIEVHDRGGHLAEIVGDLECHGYEVNAEQDPLFRGTDIHLVYARRRKAR